MPPSSGYRAARSLTASPCGTKKKRAARTHSVIELGPAAAAVANQRRLTTATTLNRTMSRKSSTRGSVGWSVAGAAVAVIGRSAFEVEAVGIQHVAQQVQLMAGGWGDIGQRRALAQRPADPGADLVGGDARIE